MNIQDVLPKDAIQSIDDPAFGSEYYGNPDDEVIVVDGDPPRVCPVRILSYHEIVNDILDDRPVAVTWCPICWSAVVYDRTVDGRILIFGTSGKLADDALVMYDRETNSEWKQPSGECITGELVGSSLTILPARMTAWKRFREAFPDGVVLQPARGADDSGGRSPRAEYDMEPYQHYFEKEEFGLYAMRGEGNRRSWDRADLDPKTVVLGVERDGVAVGYPRTQVEAVGGVVTDTVRDPDIVVIAIDGRPHAFVSPGFNLEVTDNELHGDGASWDPVTGESDDGRRLERVRARTMFAFAWQDDHGSNAFYSP